MDEDNGQMKYAPNSADVMAMIEYTKLLADVGDVDALLTLGGRLERLVDAWYATLEIPEPAR